MQPPSPILTGPLLIVSSAIIATALAGCEAKASRPTPAQLQALVEKTKSQLVPIEGGEFLMGDFGEIHNSEELPYTGQRHDGPVHKVALDSFSILKYKVTLADYDLYAASEGLPLPFVNKANHPSDRQLRANPKSSNYPAGVNWTDAQKYCIWMGKQLNRNMDLPTEAEWEYVARSRGKMIIYPTDNGKAEPGRNFSTPEQVETATGIDWGYMPVGLYPPSPMGLYDLGHNGSEWIRDWYSENYYATSPGNNPTGPATGTQKVVRGNHNTSSLPSATFERDSREPDLGINPKNVTNIGMAFRCVARDNPLPAQQGGVTQ